MDEWTAPLACPSLFSVMFWSTSIWNPLLYMIQISLRMFHTIFWLMILVILLPEIEVNVFFKKYFFKFWELMIPCLEYFLKEEYFKWLIQVWAMKFLFIYLFLLSMSTMCVPPTPSFSGYKILASLPCKWDLPVRTLCSPP